MVEAHVNRDVLFCVCTFHINLSRDYNKPGTCLIKGCSFCSLFSDRVSINQLSEALLPSTSSSETEEGRRQCDGRLTVKELCLKLRQRQTVGIGQIYIKQQNMKLHEKTEYEVFHISFLMVFPTSEHVPRNMQ